MDLQPGGETAGHAGTVDVSRVAHVSFVKIVLVAVEDVHYAQTEFQACRIEYFHLVAELEVGIEEAGCLYGGISV